MQPGNVLTSEDVPDVPVKKLQALSGSIIWWGHSFDLKQLGSDLTSPIRTNTVGQLASFCASDHRIRRRFVTWWCTSRNTLASSWITTRIRRKLLGLMVFFMLIGERATSVDWSPATIPVQLYNVAPIQSKSKLQKTVALSTAEAEYYLASLGV